MDGITANRVSIEQKYIKFSGTVLSQDKMRSTQEIKCINELLLFYISSVIYTKKNKKTELIVKGSLPLLYTARCHQGRGKLASHKPKFQDFVEWSDIMLACRQL